LCPTASESASRERGLYRPPPAWRTELYEPVSHRLGAAVHNLILGPEPDGAFGGVADGLQPGQNHGRSGSRRGGAGFRESHMRRLLLVILLSALATTSYAQRPSTLTMTCREAQSLVAKRGGVVLSTGRNTYNRFVASHRFCMPGEFVYPASAPTRDAAQCSLGYTCQSEPPPWLDDRFRRDGSFFGR
jgi:hypothetical protein